MSLKSVFSNYLCGLEVTLKGLHENKLDVTGDQPASDRLLALDLFEDMTSLSTQTCVSLEFEEFTILLMARDLKKTRRLGCLFR